MNIDNTSFYGQSIATGGGSINPIDQIIFEKFFKDKQDNHDKFFVEVGANDGLFLSTCKFFEDYLYWTGMNIEASKELYDKLVVNRPKCLNVNKILSDSLGETQFGFIDFDNGGFSHVVDGTINDAKIMRDFNLRVKNIYNIPKTTLEQLMIDHKIEKEIELMVIDVEGYEPHVIRGFGKYLPKIICVEHSHCGLSTLNALLHRYKLCWNDSMNALYERL